MEAAGVVMWTTSAIEASLSSLLYNTRRNFRIYLTAHRDPSIGSTNTRPCMQRSGEHHHYDYTQQQQQQQ
jgi:hypothetical protein